MKPHRRTSLSVLALLCCISALPASARAQDRVSPPAAALLKPAQPAKKITKQNITPPVHVPAAPPVIAPVAQASTFTLNDALAAAYANNPDLEAIRAELRATDEQYPQAFSGFRPSVTGSADYSSTHNTGNATRNGSDPKMLAVTVTQPVYSGGSTVAEVSRASNVIKAEREKLRVAEQTVLLSAVTAYMNVLRDREIVDLNISNESVLKSHVDAAREQFRLGSITKTDVSQSEARLAEAVASRIAAEGNLKTSRADFEQVIGAPPDDLVKPALLSAVPGTLEEALNEALASNPALLQAQYLSAAAEASTRAVQGALLPSVDLSGSVARVYDPATGASDHLNQTSVGVTATVPFYSAGGSTYSQVREARQTETQRRREVDSAARSVRQSVISAWATLAAASAETEARRVQIDAESMAREGVKVESEYGSRTTLDLLDAEQEYLNARVARVISERNRTVATYGLLAAVGKLTAADLKLDTPVYNPLRNFQNVKNKWAGTSIEQGK
jgi:TolC family type I secretion outer membrane protein